MSIEFIGDSGQKYTMVKRLSEGGQGYIYLTQNSNNGEDIVVKWYKAKTATADQLYQIQQLVQQGEPKPGVDGIKFIWPMELVRLPGNSSFGYVMPLYDTKNYINYNMVINGKKKQSSIDVLCRLCYFISNALNAVHNQGLAYCDINLGNINFDLDNGRIVICDNDNVVVNNADVQILGVFDFMAPEVALGKSKPSAATDLYSIAILFYQLWIWEHPMEGALSNKVRSWDIPAKMQFYAKEPLFVYHPYNSRNTTRGLKEFALSVRRWDELCPKRLKSMFIKTFTDGVTLPGKRSQLSEWERLFMELEVDVVVCPDCGAGNLVDVDEPSLVCFHCQKKLPPLLRFTIDYPGGRSHLVIHKDAKVRRHHLETGLQMQKALEVTGTIEPHPKRIGAYILRNNTVDTWYYDVKNDKFKIESGEARPLVIGGKISIGQASLTIENL